MSVCADLFGSSASEMVVTLRDPNEATGYQNPYRYIVDATSGARKGQLHLTEEAAESLYLKLGAALHGSDEPAREAAYLERQVKDAVENGLGTEGIPLMVEEPPQTWRWVDRETQGGENLD